jgi:hypothetical protein
MHFLSDWGRRLRAPTVGVGAKNQTTKKLLFLEAPFSKIGYSV